MAVCSLVFVEMGTKQRRFSHLRKEKTNLKVSKTVKRNMREWMAQMVKLRQTNDSECRRKS